MAVNITPFATAFMYTNVTTCSMTHLMDIGDWSCFSISYKTQQIIYFMSNFFFNSNVLVISYFSGWGVSHVQLLISLFLQNVCFSDFVLGGWGVAAARHHHHPTYFDGVVLKCSLWNLYDLILQNACYCKECAKYVQLTGTCIPSCTNIFTIRGVFF
jgi:hypothetical protein